jgi:hypothetical protein
MSTVRWKLVNRGVHDYYMSHRGEAGIFCFWHGKIVLPYYVYRGLGAYILISEHRDGEFIARMVRFNGYRPVRGSSTRGGAKGLKGLLKVIRKGGVIAITPDGPKGPKGRLKEGIVFLAQLTGLPVYTLGVGYSKCWQLKDWSGLKVPKPFARGVIAFGKGIKVPRELSRDGLEECRLKIENELNRCNDLAERAAAEGNW